MGKFYVDDKFRINPLSFTSGGKDVEIFFGNKQSRVYTNVKSPYKFWKQAKLDDSTIRGYKVLGKSKEE